MAKRQSRAVTEGMKMAAAYRARGVVTRATNGDVHDAIDALDAFGAVADADALRFEMDRRRTALAALRSDIAAVI